MCNSPHGAAALRANVGKISATLADAIRVAGRIKRDAAIVEDGTPLNTLSDVLQKTKSAVLIDLAHRVRGVITMIDVIDFLAA